MSQGPVATIAGCGNWLIGHDRVGPLVMTKMEGRYPEQVRTCDLGTGALALLDHLCGQRLLIIVDACVGYGERGEVLVMVPDIYAVPGRAASMHQIGPIEALVVASHLEAALMPGRVVLILVETGGLTASEEEAACEEVLEIIDLEIAALVDRRAFSRAASPPDKEETPWPNHHSCNTFKV